MSALLRDIFTIPETTSTADYVLRLTESVDDAHLARTLDDYVVTDELARAFDSALGVVASQHQARRIHGEYERERVRAQALEVEWGQLQLEQSTWATHGRVEKLARDRLHMQLPPEGQVLVVEPQS